MSHRDPQKVSKPKYEATALYSHRSIGYPNPTNGQYTPYFRHHTTAVVSTFYCNVHPTRKIKLISDSDSEQRRRQAQQWPSCNPYSMPANPKFSGFFRLPLNLLNLRRSSPFAANAKRMAMKIHPLSKRVGFKKPLPSFFQQAGMGKMGERGRSICTSSLRHSSEPATGSGARSTPPTFHCRGRGCHDVKQYFPSHLYFNAHALSWQHREQE